MGRAQFRVTPILISLCSDSQVDSEFLLNSHIHTTHRGGEAHASHSLLDLRYVSKDRAVQNGCY